MKVDMSMIDNLSATCEEETAPIRAGTKHIVLPEPEMKETEDADDESDNSDKHPKLKVFLLLIVMLAGLGLFVWNMTSFVNNVRLDNQGSANNVVYKSQDLNLGRSDGGSATDVTNKPESTAAADTNKNEQDENKTVHADENKEMDALRQQAEDAKNEAALVKQELKNAEDMLDASLAREEELQKKINKASGGE